MNSKESAPFDLAGLATADQARVELTDLTGEPTGVSLILAGPYSPQVMEAQRAGEARLQRFHRRIGGPRKLSPAQEEEHQRLVREIVTDKLAAATLGWDSPGLEGRVVYQGRELECTPENVRLVYEALPSLKERVAAVFADEANFLSR